MIGRSCRSDAAFFKISQEHSTFNYECQIIPTPQNIHPVVSCFSAFFNTFDKLRP
jgi:hypothetical protein